MSFFGDLLFGKKQPSAGGLSPEEQFWIGQYNHGVNSTNAANKARYRQMLALGRGSIGLWKGTGQQDIADIRRQGAETTAQGDQSLASRGLYNTSVLDSTHNQINQDTQAAVNRSRDQNKMGLIGLRQDLQNTIGSRNDVGPDPGFYAQLLQQMGNTDAYNNSRRRSGGIFANIFGGNLF